MSDTSIETMAEQAVALQSEIDSLTNNPDFQKFLTQLKESEAKIATIYKAIETAMIDTNTKTIKNPNVTLTIVERTNWKIEDIDQVPRKFIKKVVDTKRLTDTLKLEGDKFKLPEGVEPYTSKYLMKRFK